MVKQDRASLKGPARFDVQITIVNQKITNGNIATIISRPYLCQGLILSLKLQLSKR